MIEDRHHSKRADQGGRQRPRSLRGDFKSWRRSRSRDASGNDGLAIRLAMARKSRKPQQPSREGPAAISSIINPRDVEAGHKVYTPLMLRAYDAFVLGFSNRLLWRCPTNQLLQLYQRNIGRRHLDIGVGTGYFIDKVEWPVAMPEITLLDLNRNCLDAASARIARFKPKSVLANALEPFPAMEPFELDRLVLSPSLPAGLTGGKGCCLRSSQAGDEIRFAPFRRDHCREHRPSEPRCADSP